MITKEEVLEYCTREFGEPNREPERHGNCYIWDGKLKKVNKHYEVKMTHYLMGGGFTVYQCKFTEKFGIIRMEKTAIENLTDVDRTE